MNLQPQEVDPIQLRITLEQHGVPEDIILLLLAEHQFVLNNLPPPPPPIDEGIGWMLPPPPPPLDIMNHPWFRTQRGRRSNRKITRRYSAGGKRKKSHRKRQNR